MFKSKGPCQFAYQQCRSTLDSVATLAYSIAKVMGGGVQRVEAMFLVPFTVVLDRSAMLDHQHCVLHFEWLNGCMIASPNNFSASLRL